MNFSRIPAINGKSINVIIETPARTQSKYVFDDELRVFRLKKVLPMGMVFPFDFGFIPNTKGADGDPLDVLVITDEPSWPGCLICCRVLGVLEAVQQNETREIRNDRIVAVAEASQLYKGVKNIEQLSENMVSQIEQFFIDYNRQQGRVFKPQKWGGRKSALGLVEAAGVKG